MDFTFSQAEFLKAWVNTDIDWYMGIWQAAGATFDPEIFVQTKKSVVRFLDGEISIDEIPVGQRRIINTILKWDIFWIDRFKGSMSRRAPLQAMAGGLIFSITGMESAIAQLTSLTSER